MYTIDISNLMGPEYLALFNDLFRMTVIQVQIQLMFYILDPQKRPFLKEEFWTLLVFMWIGILSYWLIFKKLVLFK